MSGLLRRIRTGRRAASDPAPGEGAVWTAGGPEAHAGASGTPAAGHATLPADRADAAGGGPAATPAPVPAGTDLDALVGNRPTTRRRSRLRRRLRHLRTVRELLLRDLGGLVLEIHRSGAPATEAQSRLVGGKLARLDAVSTELHELEDILGDRRATILREPGIGGSCPLCGELHGSDARFCSACGTPVAPGAARPVASTGADALPPRGDAAPVAPPAAGALPPLALPSDPRANPTWATEPAGEAGAQERA